METRYELYELKHHGVKGQKWGVRRYQKKDGSLTFLGKRRQKKIQATRVKNLEKARAAKAAKKTQANSTSQPKQKTVKDMTDAELREKINRAQLERQYAQLYPKKVSMGKKFADKVINDVVAPAATNAARNLAQDYINKKGKELLGLNEAADPMKKLKKEVDNLNIRKQKIELDEFFEKRKNK